MREPAGIRKKSSELQRQNAASVIRYLAPIVSIRNEEGLGNTLAIVPAN